MTEMLTAPVIDRVWTQEQITRNLNRVLNPAVCLQALQALKRPDSDFGAIAATLQGDPFIAAKVVGLANMLRRAGDPTIASIQRAVAVLGTRHVQTLVLAVMLTGPLVSADGDVPRRKDLWRWVFGCAAAGDYLGKSLPGDANRPGEQQYLVGGLLLGLGALVLQAGLGREYGKILGTQLRPLRLAQREERALGVTHHQVTLWTLESMRCPPELAAVVRPLAERRDDDAALRARAIEMLGARAVGLEAPRAEAWLAEALPQIGVRTENLVEEALPVIRARVRELTRVFTIDLGDWQQRQETRQTVMIMAGQTLDALLIDHARLQAQTLETADGSGINGVDRQPQVDPATGLLTRHGWDRQFLPALPVSPTPLGLLVLRVDGFEEFVQQHGAQQADRALGVVSTILRSTRSEPVMVGRFTRDVLVGVYLLRDGNTLDTLVEELRWLLIQPDAAVAGAYVSVSIGGVAATSDELRAEWETHYRRAEANLNAAVKQGDGNAVLTA